MKKSKEEKLVRKITEELNKPKPNVENLVEIFKSQEKLDTKTLEKLKRVRRFEVERINNGLRQCISAHGPITKEFIGSASKRIFGACILNSIEETKYKRISIRDLLIGVVITSILFIILT
jgi:hypothetical protein